VPVGRGVAGREEVPEAPPTGAVPPADSEAPAPVDDGPPGPAEGLGWTAGWAPVGRLVG